MPLYKDTRHVALNIPRTDVGDRIMAAIFMEREISNLSMSAILMRIVTAHIASQDREYHDAVDEVQNEIERQRICAERGEVDFGDTSPVFGPPK